MRASEHNRHPEPAPDRDTKESGHGLRRVKPVIPKLMRLFGITAQTAMRYVRAACPERTAKLPR